MVARLYLISASHVSAARFSDLAARLEAASDCLSKTIRLDDQGQGLWSALDDLSNEGVTRIEVRPVGLPFSQSLESWLPRAIGGWIARQAQPCPQMVFSSPLQDDDAIISAVANAPVELTNIESYPGGEIGKGWDNPPPMDHHLLVCTGPRCHMRDSPGLLQSLKKALGDAGISDSCLITTTGCAFPCNNGPVLIHYPKGDWYRLADQHAVQQFVQKALVSGIPPRDLIIHQTGKNHEIA